MDPDFRPMNRSEKELLERLLQEDSPSMEALRKQLEGLLVKTIHPDGSLALRVAESAPDAWDGSGTGSLSPDQLLSLAVPVEGRYLDTDGVPVSLLLHVSDGALRELEIVKADGSSILCSPFNARISIGAPRPQRSTPPGALW